MSDEEYYQEFMQDLYARSGANNDFLETVFTERICDFLVDQAIVQNYSLAEFKKNSLGIRVDAWNYHDETGILSLFVVDVRTEKSVGTLTQTEVEKIFKRLEKFFDKCQKPDFHSSLEESTQGYAAAREIYENRAGISRVQFFLLSNATLSSRVKSIVSPDDTRAYHIWDLSRIARLNSPVPEPMIIKFEDFIGTGVPCLPAFTGSSSFESYLLVMPGSLIATLYDKYGERLLEQNVRTFLQFRGDVNKGIRNTIKNNPHMFFAYNNGLSATAECVDLAGGNMMTSVTNLQIVNGGQTTASLFTTMRKENADLSKVYVQVKLSVIPAESVEEVVPRISEFANTQNKVNAADFFSNHPFHLRMESFSRRLWAPSVGGGLAETRWFYERARGQYANIQAKMTDSQKRQFLMQHPKSQMFTKTDLAKFEHTMEMLPHTVSKGAQFNFAQFAGNIGKRWDQNEAQFNELYFKRLIAKAILFRTLDQQVMQQPWYGGYKANIVAYSLAKLAHLTGSAGKYIDFLSIWRNQKASPAMESQLILLAKLINEKITDTELNVTQYCKQEICWQRVREIKIKLNEDLLAELIETEEIQELEKEAKRGQKILKGIEAQMYVVEKGAKYWNSMITWGDKILADSELSFLASASKVPVKLPTEKQCERILEIERRALKEGFCADE